MHCEYALGAAWICQPLRWGVGPDGTLDGCVPVRIAWARFGSLSMHRAIDKLDTAGGIGLAFGSEAAGDAARQGAIDDAFPRE